MTTSFRYFGFGILCSLILVWLSACKYSETRPDIKIEMRDSYAAAYALFRDIWSNDRFKDIQHRSDTISNIDRLLNNVHSVEQKTEHSKYDAGFFLALELNREFLLDAKRRLQHGHVDYAAWRLRGVMHNCIACHTRYEAPVKFVGEVPKPESQSPDDLLDAADFLVATRQFEKASDLLLKIATAPGAMNFIEQAEFRALKLWLVVQMRASTNFLLIAAKLKELSTLGKFRGEASTIVNQWLIDLKRYGDEAKPRSTLQDAELLTASLNDESNFTKDDQSLVSTLYATTILHSALPTLKDDARRKAIYLLGLSYHHIQVQQLNVFTGLYLEQCIKEFPHTEEARKSFDLFQSEIEFLFSGNSGLNLDEEDRKKVESLRSLAY